MFKIGCIYNLNHKHVFMIEVILNQLSLLQKVLSFLKLHLPISKRIVCKL